MQNKANQTERDYAKEQAISQVQSIQDMIAAYEMDWDRLEELWDSVNTQYGANNKIVRFVESDTTIRLDFECFADSDDHAIEQCQNAYPGCDVLYVEDIFTEDDKTELQELEETSGDYTSQDEALEAIQEHPLSIEYRSGWTTPGEDLSPEEFRVVLCTGGPHVEILGEFDYNGGIDRVRVIYKDWGTSGELFDFDRAAVMTYCELIGVGSF